MFRRIVTAVVGIPAFLLFLYLGGMWWTGFVAVLAALAAREIVHILVKHRNISTPSTHLIVFGGVLFVLLAYQSNANNNAFWLPSIVAIVIITLISEVLRFDRSPIDVLGSTLFGTLYPASLFAHLVLLRLLPDGFMYMLMVTLGTWISDSAAYFIGKAFGRKKLIPSVSPNKTWAGSLGGSAATVVFGMIMASFINVHFLIGGVLGLIISVAGQLGDLSASAIKRDVDIKDTGQLLPGHGGIIDRFDSLLFASTVMYYAILLIP